MNREVHVRIRGGRGVKVPPATRPREVIVLTVRWYLRYGLSYRDVEELLAERGAPSPSTPPAGPAGTSPGFNDACAASAGDAASRPNAVPPTAGRR
jgi:hypothetical protein